ncbi:hypothetical protein MHOL44478_12300 [Mycobacterium holsaticum DSM 44478]|uniref:HNH endonuclease signature motif containing protein n=2 Tax=Mycolicibacterium holsaticum TaxID=152142 RepID=UPI002329CDC1|nr:hypothetical protein [Mycolicibacterium holsaticum DSM 44478 = JCM 12374]
MIERMFGSKFRSVEEADLIAEIQACTRAEAMTAARRLAATGELAARSRESYEEREHWVADGWNCAAAEVAAAMGIGRYRAGQQMAIGLALRNRLPKVAALFSEGLISADVISTITWRTHLVLDGEPLARVDAEIAERASSWGALGQQRLELAVDAVVETHDPDARRRYRDAAQNCDVQVGKPDDATGTASLYGRLDATDAKLLMQCLEQMVAGICDGDPRNAGQRRAAALGALAAGADRLTCQCGSPQCPWINKDDPRAARFVIHVLADTVPTAETPAEITAGLSRDTHTDAEPEGGAAAAEAPAAEEPPPKVEPTPPQAKSKANLWAPNQPDKPATAAVIVGGGVIPPALLAELVANGAKVQSVYRPDGADPEPRYRPSRACERFVRLRDMTCRFPGCDRPAEYCDLDHTTPYPDGPTHPSNIKCVCRFHHLLKTFCGWSDQQGPDGTIIWTAPSGHTYRTHPTSKLYFPHWDTATADLPPPANAPPPSAQRALKMPRRRRTRAAEKEARITAERKLNATAPQPDF